MRRRTVITGGAGFIGCNLAVHCRAKGDDVVVLDNLHRPAVRDHAAWLQHLRTAGLQVVDGDVREPDALRRVIAGADAVYHTAGQTAVTTSVADPVEDFEINARGTLNVLEAVRHTAPDAVLIFTSTNKVYGAMADVPIAEHATRYAYADARVGIDERQPLDFQSPYACSNGAADQYALDYARIYGLRTVVFRLGSIYGPGQFALEEQGWVTYFILAALDGVPLTIYGDGKQVRDVLYVDDLVRAFELATERIDATAGQVYNIGGGPGRTVSIWKEFAPLLGKVLDRPLPQVGYREWRPGDQRIYVSDIRKAQADLGWQPELGIEDGIRRVSNWIRETRHRFQP